MSASFQMPAHHSGVELWPNSRRTKPEIPVRVRVRVIPVLICAQDAHQSHVGSWRCSRETRPSRYFPTAKSERIFVGVGAAQIFCFLLLLLLLLRISAKGVAQTDDQAAPTANCEAA